MTHPNVPCTPVGLCCCARDFLSWPCLHLLVVELVWPQGEAFVLSEVITVSVYGEALWQQVHL